jgi:putative zinc finger protein
VSDHISKTSREVWFGAGPIREVSGKEMNYENKTPNCDLHEALVAYLYEESTAGERSRVEAHLAECAACKQELAGFERVRGMLQQWQLDDLPVVRIETAKALHRSALEVLKELFTVMPLWTKVAGAVATALLVFAVLGTEVSIGRNGFSMRADVLRSGGQQAINAGSPEQASVEQLRAEMKTIVNTMILESERQQKEELKAQLVSFETQLQNMHSADLARLASNIQEHRNRIKTLERDIDRREGLDLTDILFSEVINGSGEKATTKAESGGD